MPIDFPTSPTVGQTYTFAGTIWQWNGVAWDNTGAPNDTQSLTIAVIMDIY